MSKKRTAVQPRPPSGRRPPSRRSRFPGWLLPVGMVVLALATLVVAAVLYSRSGPAQPARLPTTAVTGQAVDGIRCERQEQVLFHIHAHLAIFADGRPRTVPAGIGIPDAQSQNTSSGPVVGSGSCFYWMHSHTADGLIHVESPVQRTFTLGDWFDIWGRPLGASQVGSDKGTVIAYVNGQRHEGDPRQIPLQEHTVIQLDVGTDVAPRPYTFPNGL